MPLHQRQDLVLDCKTCSCSLSYHPRLWQYTKTPRGFRREYLGAGLNSRGRVCH
jgi:hypothetical protein